MIAPEYLNVLREICARLADGDVNWAVTGSLGFALQGVPVAVHDVDIQTDAAGAYEIERRFAGSAIQRVTFSSAERIRSHFGALVVDGIRVEIMGDVQKRLPDGSWEDAVPLDRHKRVVDVAGLRVPVLSLEYEHEAYLKLGRVERAALLRRWLDAQPRSPDEQASSGK